MTEIQIQYWIETYQHARNLSIVLGFTQAIYFIITLVIAFTETTIPNMKKPLLWSGISLVVFAILYVILPEIPTLKIFLETLKD